jgi:hypothetical protein
MKVAACSGASDVLIQRLGKALNPVDATLRSINKAS